MASIVSAAALTGVLLTGPQAAAQGPAAIASKDLQSMTYEVYAGGINAVSATLDVGKAEDKGDYRLELTAETKGLLGRLAPWSGSFETEGFLEKNGKEMPEIHRSTATWQGEEEVKEYYYGKDGTFKGYYVKEENRDEKIMPDEALTKGTIDVLTATLYVMDSVAKNGKCEGESEVFDGRRRFKLVFNHEADEMLEATRYNAYSGMAARCVVEVEPVAGAWHKKPRGWLSIQEQGRQKGSLPTVWMAKVSEDGPAVPVKLRVKTDYGTLFMHLIKYSNDGAVKIAEKAD